MKAIVLVDNTTHCALGAEWGLAVWLEFQDRTYLLDTGASPLFAENAKALGLDLTRVEAGILSHAHSDHADGMAAFFEENPAAPFYLQAACAENCYDLTDQGYRYEGIRRGTLSRYAHRIRYVDGRHDLAPRVTLLPHSVPDLAGKGQAKNMFRKTDAGFIPDDLAHEQSLIFDTDRGLVVCNSCCHAGADVILQEAAAAFPGRPLRAILGGFHLFETPPEEVATFARRLAATGVERVVTGHCTGSAAFAILKDILGEKLVALETGLTLTF